MPIRTILTLAAALRCLLVMLIFTFAIPFAAHAEQRMDTPFGHLSVGTENQLLLNGTPVQPDVSGEVTLSFVEKFSLANQQAVLIAQIGGTACPAKYRWVLLSADGYKVSPEFGSCSDLVRSQVKEGKLIVSMPAFKGQFESEAEQTQAADRQITYIYDGTTVVESDAVPAAAKQVVGQVKCRLTYDQTRSSGLGKQGTTNTQLNPAFARYDDGSVTNLINGEVSERVDTIPAGNGHSIVIATFPQHDFGNLLSFARWSLDPSGLSIWETTSLNQSGQEVGVKVFTGRCA